MSFWAAAQLQPQRDGLALQCLRQAGFETYAPRLREPRIAHGRKVTRTPLLFVSYVFVLIELQWHTARWAPGVVRLVMNGVGPAAVPDGRHRGPQGPRDRRADRSPKAPEISPRRPPASHPWPVCGTRRALCRHEAARAGGGVAGDPGGRPARHAGRRCGRAGAVIIPPGMPALQPQARCRRRHAGIGARRYPPSSGSRRGRVALAPA